MLPGKALGCRRAGACHISADHMAVWESIDRLTLSVARYSPPAAMSATLTRFRPGSHQRGEETRERILRAALELFAANGFEGASTRTIAEKAQVNLPAIQYYFGSKEGLYRAVVEQFAEELQAAVTPVAERIQSELANARASRQRLLDLLCDMLDIVIALILDDSVPDRASRQRFFARMEVEPNAAVEALQDDMIRHVCTPCCAIIGRLIDQPPDDELVRLHAMTIIGQAKIFCGWGTSRVLHWDVIGEARTRSAQSVVRQHVQAAFRATRSR
jgi:TetR/AcrR family transcriptional regulator, regulator of cefoperazone and chloramphenicol sensitivity